MNRRLKNYSLILLLITMLLPSCTAYKKTPYLKDAGSEKAAISKSAEPIIHPYDLLTIVVNTTTPEASSAFNLPLIPTSVIGNVNVSSPLGLQTYLVESNGTINFPILGEINIAGMSKKAVEKLIKEAIYPKYITEEPIVSIRFVNYKISVLGEVLRPGNFTINNERVSVFDALALAGDMTIHGQRNNVLIIREMRNGEKETVRLDLQNKTIISSPYYYLQQNDVVYVTPNKHKGNSSAVSTSETLAIPIASIALNLTSLIIYILR